MSYPANASALLEFRKPEVFDPMKRYPPSAIWQQSSRRRQIKLPRGRKQLTKKELEKYFGKAFSFVGSGGELSYEEGRARADAVQAQRVRGERLAILDREVNNNRDRLRLQREINAVDERVRMRQLDIEDRRFRYQGEQAERREEGEERRFAYLAEQGERRERLDAENLARTDRLYDDQRRFFQEQLEVGERRRGEWDARMLETLGNTQRQRGQDVPLRFVVEPEEERSFEDITSPLGEQTERRPPRSGFGDTGSFVQSPTLSTAVSKLRANLQQPSPSVPFAGGAKFEPEPEPQRLPTPPPSPKLSPVKPEELVAGGGGSPAVREEASRIADILRRQLSLEAGAVEIEQQRARELEQAVAERTPRGLALRTSSRSVREGLAEELGGLTPRDIVARGQEIIADAEEDLDSPSPIASRANIAQIEQQIEDRPETALGQLGRVAGGVVSAITGLAGGGSPAIARVPVRPGEQAGGLGVAIQGEEGAVAEGVFGGGGDDFLLPEGAGLVEELEAQEAPKPTRSREDAREELEAKRLQLREAERAREKRRAGRYEPVDFAQLRQIQRKGEKIKLPKEQGELFLEVREPFDKTYVGKNAGLYKVKNIPSLEGTGASNTQKFNLTYEHYGKKAENQLNPYKKVAGKNVFQEALSDGRIRFVLKPKGDVSPTD